MRISDKKDLYDLIHECKGALQKLGVRRLGVFGSFARDESQSQSDIDLLVEFVPGMKSFDNFMELAHLIEDQSGREADIVTVEGLSPYIGPYILKEVEFIAF
jgi:hypothetical protein